MGDLVTPGPWRDVAAGAAYVAHCARQVPSTDYAARTKMDHNLLSALSPQALKRAVIVSGSSYFGRTERDRPVDETMSPRRPLSGATQIEPCMEQVRASRAKGMDEVVAYVGGVYGPRSWFTNWCVSAIQKGEPILLRDPPPIWPFIHIDDAARAIVALLGADKALLDQVGRDIIVADDEPAPMDAFVRLVAQELGKEPQLVLTTEEALRQKLPATMAEYLASDMVHSNARLKRLGVELRYPNIRAGIPHAGLRGS
jgi:nucleoside-diphosphate-sugar epimerase